MRRTLFSTTLLALVAASSTAFAQTMVKEIDVSADLTAIENPLAATYWTDLSDDVENAIVARLTDRTDEDGVSITIDLSEVELSNSFQEALNIADTKLVGDVKVTSATDNTAFNTYNLTVNIDQALLFLPEGTDVTMLSQDSTEYYDALINAFADAVVVRLD